MLLSAAQAAGKFKDEIVAVELCERNKPGLFEKDEHNRPDTTVASLSKLRPAFRQDGTITAGNAPGLNTGAAAMIVAERNWAEKHGLKPRAKIKAFANIGSEPSIMLTGPVDVTKKVLARAGMKLEDIDLFELNEAFASVVLRYIQAFDIDHAKINVNGGAIAMGHPLGATGAMILGTVLDELERRDLNTALVTLCIGGGMGTATVIERV